MVVNVKKILFFFFAFFSFLKLSASPDIVWSSPPDTLSSTSVDSSAPNVVMDSSGNAIAVWLENGVVKTASHPVMGSWGSTTTLSGASASSPYLAINAAGDAVAVWIESNVVKARVQPSGGSWGTVNTVSSSGASAPKAIIDASGNAVAVWVRSNVVESATKLLGFLWGLVASISGGSSSNPDIAIGGDGTIVSVWNSVISSQNRVLSSTFLIGGVWGAAKTISNGSNQNNYPHIALDVNGNALAIWYQYNVSGSVYSNVTATVSTLANGASNWTTPVVLSSKGSVNPASLKARPAFDSLGNSVAIWSNSSDGQTYDIQTSTFQIGAGWSDVADIGNNLYDYQGDIAVASSVNTAAAIMDYDGMNILIQTTESNINTVMSNFWSPPQTISSGTDNKDPRIGLALSGTTIYGVALWTAFDGSHTVIQAVTGTGSAVLAPSSPMVSQSSTNFGVFTEYFNTLSWTASSDPNLASYEIYRNGIFIDEVSAGTTSYIDHNAVQSGAVTYGVAAQNTAGFQSQTVSVSFP